MSFIGDCVTVMLLSMMLTGAAWWSRQQAAGRRPRLVHGGVRLERAGAAGVLEWWEDGRAAAAERGSEDAASQVPAFIRCVDHLRWWCWPMLIWWSLQSTVARHRYHLLAVPEENRGENAKFAWKCAKIARKLSWKIHWKSAKNCPKVAHKCFVVATKSFSRFCLRNTVR